MNLHWLDRNILRFPPVDQAWPADSPVPGILAAGGSLDLNWLRHAYKHGIFPWYAPGQPILWWSPDPRMVLQVRHFKLSRSLRKTIGKFRRNRNCEIRIDSCFERVIEGCSSTPRPGQDGTWIVPEMVQAYADWHRAGEAHSFECWMDGELAGGLYGVSLGRMFYGESMFAHRTDASKIALAALVCFCRANRIDWIDCQQNTSHLASLGAAEVSRAAFLSHVAKRTGQAGPIVWAYHDSLWDELSSNAE
jgi:leucyl/phenylalanyl-tRNA--protein transferase